MKNIRRLSQNGLSLIELIIALALMSMIVVISYPSLSLIIRSWNSIEFETTPSDQFAVERFVRHKVQQTALIFEKERSTRENLLAFSGHPDGFRFVSPMDDFLRQPGLYSVGFEIKEKDATQHIVFGYQPYTGQLDDLIKSDSSQMKRRLLVENVSAASMDYYSAKRRVWVSDWSDQKQLPALIRFQFIDASAVPKRWVIEPKMARIAHRLTDL